MCPEVEIWKPIPGYENYEASNLGRVRSIRVLSPAVRSHDGYQALELTKDGQQKSWRVHQLVLMAFTGEKPEGMHGCHNDGDKTNNRADNLRWDTPAENHKDMVRHRVNAGEKHPRAKLTEEQVTAIRAMLKEGMTNKAIANVMSISPTTVGHIKTGRRWPERSVA